MDRKEILDKIAEIINEHKQKEIEELRRKMRESASEGIGLANKYWGSNIPHEIHDFLYSLPRD